MNLLDRLRLLLAGLLGATFLAVFSYTRYIDRDGGWPVSWLCSALTAVTVAVEFLQPVALFSRAARLFLVPGVIMMLLSIRALHGPVFFPMVALQIFWVDWSGVLDRLRDRRRPASSRTF